MPRGKADSARAEAIKTQNTLLWGQTGKLPEYSLTEWDIKTEAMVTALLEVLSTGASVLLRPGSGARSIGWAIWEGDARHAPKWLYSDEEVDEYVAGLLELVRQRKSKE
jgi:hypothetical protein